MMDRRIIFLIAVILLSGLCMAEVKTSASVANSPPSIKQILTFDIFFSPDDSMVMDDFFLCRNLDEKRVYMMAVVEDKNGIDESLNYADVIIRQSDGLPFERFGSPIIMDSAKTGILEENFSSSYDMVRSDKVRVDPEAYTVAVEAGDGEALSNGTKNFTFDKQDCLGYFMISNVTGSVLKTDADSELGIQLSTHVGSPVLCAVSIVWREGCIFGCDALSSYGLDGYYEIRFSPGLSGIDSKTYFRVHYNSTDAKKKKLKEKRLVLVRWNGISWEPLDDISVDKKNDLVYGAGQGDGFFAIADKDIFCQENWKCGRWSACMPPGFRTRDCVDKSECGTMNEIPDLTKGCVIKGKRNLPEPDDEGNGDQGVDYTKGNPKKYLLFDIYADLLSDAIESGDEIVLMVGLINFGDPGLVDVNLTYFIYDSHRDLVYKEDQIVSLEGKTEFLKSLNVSKLDDGKYSLLIHLDYEGQEEPAEVNIDFAIDRSGSDIFYWVILLLVIAVSIFIWRFKRHKRNKEQEDPELLKRENQVLDSIRKKF